jgi:hypothetical protein
MTNDTAVDRLGTEARIAGLVSNAWILPALASVLSSGPEARLDDEAGAVLAHAGLAVRADDRFVPSAGLVEASGDDQPLA